MLPDYNNPDHCAQLLDNIATQISNDKKVDQASISTIDKIIKSIEQNSLKSPQIDASMGKLLDQIKEVHQNQPSSESQKLISKIEKTAVFAPPPKSTTTTEVTPPPVYRPAQLSLLTLPGDTLRYMFQFLDVDALKVGRVLSKRLKGLSDEAIINLVNSEKLALSDLGLSWEGVLKLINEHGNKLKYLDIKDLKIPEVEPGIKMILEKCPNLEHILLKQIKSMYGEMKPIMVSKNFPLLLTDIHTRYPNLKTLDLEGFEIPNDTALEPLARFSNLERLNLSGYNRFRLNGSCLAYISGLTGLKALNLNGFHNTGLVTSHLTALTNLEELRLSPNIINYDLGPLSGLSKLKVLNFSEGAGNNVLNSGIAAFTHLEELHLTGETTAAGLAQLTGMTNLRKLSIYRTGITDADLAPLTHIQSLRSINLNMCSSLTDSALVHLAALKNLETLLLDNINITRNGLAHLCPPNGLSNLKNLSLTGIWNRQDNDLTPLSVLTSLQRLNLAGNYNITDACLTSLTTLTNLRILNVNYCKILTEEGLSTLLSLLGNLEIINEQNEDWF